MKNLLAAVAIGAAATLGVAGCASQNPEAKRSAGEFTDDAALTAKVKTAIATNVGARAAGSINVETYKGVVQLSGFVDSKDMAERALAAARKVGGVNSVRCRIDRAIQVRRRGNEAFHYFPATIYDLYCGQGHFVSGEGFEPLFRCWWSWVYRQPYGAPAAGKGQCASSSL